MAKRHKNSGVASAQQASGEKEKSPTVLDKESAIEIVRSFLTGAKLAKFNEGMRIWSDSLALGCWVKRGRRKADSAFYAGLLTLAQFRKITRWTYEQERCVRWGKAFKGSFEHRQIEAVKGLTHEVLDAWAFMCVLKDTEFAALTEARPKPIITPIGASPRVTATLKECNLDVDLSTIKPAAIERVELAGPPKQVFYRVKWSAGTQLGVSRFGGGDNCELCGKFIPSGRFVAMEMADRSGGVSRLIGMWVGRDCAETLLGVDDVGVDRAAIAKATGKAVTP